MLLLQQVKDVQGDFFKLPPPPPNKKIKYGKPRLGTLSKKNYGIIWEFFP